MHLQFIKEKISTHLHGELDADSWKYREVVLQEKGCTIWTAIVNIAKDLNNRRIVYDVITNKNPASELLKSGKSYHNAVLEGVPSANNITENNADVNF